MSLTSTGHIIPGLDIDAELPVSTLRKVLRVINEELTVPNGTLTMRQLAVLDERRRAVVAEIERRY